MSFKVLSYRIQACAILGQSSRYVTREQEKKKEEMLYPTISK
jgi:hypothetical protein